MTKLCGYAAAINKCTGVTDPDILAEIEDHMRDEYRTLDHLSSEKFARCARECWAAVQYERTPAGRAEMTALWAEMGMPASSCPY